MWYKEKKKHGWFYSAAFGFTIPSIICIFLLFFFLSKTIQINIIDDEEYEKNKNFFLEIGEPQLLEMSERKGGGVALTSSNPTHNTNDISLTKVPKN